MFTKWVQLKWITSVCYCLDKPEIIRTRVLNIIVIKCDNVKEPTIKWTIHEIVNKRSSSE